MLCPADKTHPTFAAEPNMMTRDLKVRSRCGLRKTLDFCSQNVGPQFYRQNASPAPAMTYDQPPAKLKNKTQKSPSANDFRPQAAVSRTTKLPPVFLWGVRVSAVKCLPPSPFRTPPSIHPVILSKTVERRTAKPPTNNRSPSNKSVPFAEPPASFAPHPNSLQ
jgi:hypothetical protein